MEIDDGDDFTKKMEALKASFAAKLPDRLSEIEHSLGSLKSEPTAENIERRLTQILNFSHKLTGSGGTFGFADVSKKSAVVEERCEALLQEATAFRASYIDELDGLVRALETSIQNILIQGRS